MSIVGYILGLGDRHPSNLMMNRRSGKIIHIDFGDCFEVAMKREKFPEKVPFRLTRTLIKALEISEIEGTFRIVCEQIMEILRDNKDSLLAILGSFIHDPLISFRLMIPLIMKNKSKVDNFHSNIKFKRNPKKKRSDKVLNKKNFFNNLSTSMRINNKPIVRLSRIFNPIFVNNENDEYKKENRERKVLFKLKDEKEKEKPESINEEQEKNEKKKMESDERQIFNQYEENDEYDLEELNKIAQIVLDRIHDKLSGTDFNPDIVYDVKSQVNKLIQLATSNENLAQSYLGWCPFW
jgi:FKBP12-rapamycin complex-associated protein